MIRKLTKNDHEQVWAFVTREPSKNLFMIGDIEVFGYDQDFQELWGQFEAGELRAVLLRYHEFFIMDGLPGYDAKSFAEIIDGKPVSGSEPIIEELIPYLPMEKYVTRATYFAECTFESWKGSQSIEPKEIKKATIEDVPAIIELVFGIEEFTDTSPKENRIARKVQALETGAGRDWFVERDGKVISVVSTTAENSKSAMIVGVCTHPDYRKQGLVTEILNVALSEILAEKEVACLFYDNPKAGAIYKRSGFYDIGMWTMLTVK